MEVAALLRSLGAGREVLTDRDRNQLDERGYLALEGTHSRDEIARIHAAVEEKFRTRTLAEGRAGGTLHLRELEDAGPVFDRVWLEPRLLAGVHHLLGDAMRLRELQYRAPTPGHGAQALHVDWGFAVEPGEWQVCTALVALVDIDATMGATRVVPGTHLERRIVLHPSPDEHEPGEILLTGRAGTVFLFNGHLRHSGTRNETSSTVRHALLVNWGRGSSANRVGPSDATIDRLGDAAWLVM